MEANRAAAITVPVFGEDARQAAPAGGSRFAHWLRSVASFGYDVALLGLVVASVPFVVLLLGLPIAAVVWGLLEVVKRLL